MAIQNKLQEIQVGSNVYEIQPRSVENRNTADASLIDKYDWIGTIEQYQTQQIATLHPEWVCYITNDIKDGEGALDLSDYVKKEDYNYDQGDVVHRNGDEVILGLKTFTENNAQVSIVTKSQTVDDTQTPAQIQYTDLIDNHDVNDVLLSRVSTSKQTDGSNRIDIQAWKGNANYSIGVDSNGHTYAPTPSASSSTSNLDIATTGWVNDATKSTNVVHKDGTETIDGSKTFTNAIHMGTKDITTPNTTITTLHIPTTTANGNGASYMEVQNRNDGSNASWYNIVSNVGNQYSVVGAITDGTDCWSFAPPSDKLNSIVTTEGISKSSSGYVKFGNGLIIQWLYNVQTPSTVTLPTPFTSTNYCCASMSTGSTAHEHNISVYNKTTTTFQVANGYPSDILVIGY